MAQTAGKTLQLARNELNSFLARSKKNLKSEFILSPKETGGSVSMRGGALVFSAPTETDILHTVYAFAEKFLGFCFFEPGCDRCNADLERPLEEGLLLTLTEPKIKRRGFIQEFPFSKDSYILADWMARSRLNYLLVWMKYYDAAPPELKEYFAERGIEIESGHHNFDYWIPLEKYCESNPEFFAVTGGRRVKYEKGDSALLLSKQLCVTNPELRAEIVRNMVKYARANPELKTISLIPNDGFGWCECGECSKFYDPGRKGEIYSVSEHVYKADKIYHDMFEDIAARLRKELPDINLTLCAYVNYSAPSDGFTLKKGSAVHFAPYWRCSKHKIYDGTCPINSRYAEDFKKWAGAKRGGELNIYEYLMGVNLYVSFPNVLHEDIFDEIDWFSSNGADGYLTQFHIPHWTVYGLNFYCMAKAAAGAGKKETSEYLLKSLFGRDAMLAKKFYERSRQLAHDSGKCLVTYPHALLSRVKLERYEELNALAGELL
jgi:hypothetical protein